MLSKILATVVALLVFSGISSTHANELSAEPVLGVESLARSLASDKNNQTLRTGLHGAIRKLGKDPTSAPDLVSLGDEFANKNKAAASALYYEALRLKDEPATWAKWRSMQSGSQAVSSVRPLTNEPDFGPYMADLQRQIKKKWFPPKGHEGDRISVSFTVNSDGTLKGLRLASGAAFEPSNKAALDAVRAGAPFRPLPQYSPATLDIQFTFDYNLFQGKGSGTFRKF